MSSLQERQQLIQCIKNILINAERGEIKSFRIPETKPYELIVLLSYSNRDRRPQIIVIPVLAEQTVISFLLTADEAVELMIPLSPEISDDGVEFKQLTDENIEALDELYFRALQAFFNQTGITE